MRNEGIQVKLVIVQLVVYDKCLVSLCQFFNLLFIALFSAKIDIFLPAATYFLPTVIRFLPTFTIDAMPLCRIAITYVTTPTKLFLLIPVK